MIRTIQALLNTMSTDGIACALNTTVVTPKTEVLPLDFCVCKYQCDYTEYALSSDDGESYKNDFTSILIDLIDIGAEFHFYLTDGTTQTELLDDTYGTYYGPGTLEQNNKVGYKIDWKLVFDLLGSGLYRIQVELTEFGTTLNQESHTYNVTTYSEELADGTVRIQTVNSGCILNGIDYTGMEWERSVRLPGRIGGEEPQLEQIETVDSQRRTIQIQQSTRDQFLIETGLIPSNVYDFIKSDMKSSEIFVDDYNLFAFREIKNKKVSLAEFQDVQTDFQRTTYGRVSVLVNDDILELKRNI